MMFLKVDVSIAESGEVKTCDAIHLEGHVWLVSKWFEDKEQGLVKPARLIRLAQTELEQPASPSCDFVLKKPIASDVLFGTEVGQFEVRERPDLTFASNLVFPTSQ